jgi:flagellar hook-associated protein 2
MNRKAPLYSYDNNKESIEFAIGMKENARQLSDTIISLGGADEGEILSKRIAYSSNPEAVEANFVGDSKQSANAPEFDIEVRRLAAGQRNTGNALPATEKIGLPVGAYSYDLNISEMNYEFQFNVNEGETNQDIQKRVARLFENSDLGIEATVVMDEDGNSALDLQAENIGLPANREYQFRISDDKTSRTAGAVEYLGIDKVVQEASNAEFYLNGDMRVAYSNSFTIEKLYELNLNGTSEEAIHIGLMDDTDSIDESINSMINGYNDFIRSADDQQSDRLQGRRVASEMRHIAALYQDDMAALGVQVKEDGSLAKADVGALEYSGLKAIKAFTSAVLRKSNQINLNPMEYVDKKVIAYKHPRRSLPTPYVTSAYSGMIFSGFC